jgi:glutamate synthase domain-containing protein 1
MASFGAQPCGTCHFCTLRRYFSLMCILHTALEMPCSASKMAVSLQPELMLAVPHEAGMNSGHGDHFHDECGVFGVFDHPEAANLTYLGLYAQQHRGQESAGIVCTDGHSFNTHRGMGLVADVFKKSDIKELRGRHSIGHVRYSTSGESGLRNCQPFSFEYAHGGIAMCHNGNIVNAQELRRQLE